MELTITYWEAGLGIIGMGILLIGIAYLRRKMRLRRKPEKVNLNYVSPQKETGEAFVHLFEAESERALKRIHATVENEKVQLLKLIESSPRLADGIQPEVFGQMMASGDRTGENPLNSRGPEAFNPNPYEVARQYAESGMAHSEISATLNMPLAEVELAVKVSPIPA